MRVKKLYRTVLLGGCMSLAAAAITFASEKPEEETPQLMVGAAVRDVTPTEDMLPIDGTGRTTLEGVLDPMHVRVIALQSLDETALVVVTETGRGPYGPEYVSALSEHTGIPEENIFYCSTHSHAVPEITESVELEFDENDESVTNLQKWGRLAYDQMLEAADEAINKLEPASVGIGYSESYINVNRNRWYVDENGEPVRTQGFNGAGNSDKTVAAVEFDNADGDPIAFIINYAVHGTVMYANTCLENGGTGISADIPGYVSTCLENKYEGAVAAWISGAAGDQNPIIVNEFKLPDPDTGMQETSLNGCYELLEYLGKIHYSDVESALKQINSMVSHVEISCDYEGTTIPNRDDKIEENGEELALQLQMLRVGDIAFVGCAGELFNSIGVSMKENSVLKDTIIVNHCWNQEEQFANYLPDDEGIIYGAQGVRSQPYAAGYITDALTNLMNTMISNSND